MEFRVKEINFTVQSNGSCPGDRPSRRRIKGTYEDLKRSAQKSGEIIDDYNIRAEAVLISDTVPVNKDKTVRREKSKPIETRQILFDRRYVFGEVVAIDDVLKSADTDKPHPALEDHQPYELRDMIAEQGITHLYRQENVNKHYGQAWDRLVPGTVVMDRATEKPIAWMPSKNYKLIDMGECMYRTDTRGGAITAPDRLAKLSF